MSIIGTSLETKIFKFKIQQIFNLSEFLKNYLM